MAINESTRRYKIILNNIIKGIEDINNKVEKDKKSENIKTLIIESSGNLNREMKRQKGFTPKPINWAKFMIDPENYILKYFSKIPDSFLTICNQILRTSEFKNQGDIGGAMGVMTTKSMFIKEFENISSNLPKCENKDKAQPFLKNLHSEIKDDAGLSPLSLMPGIRKKVEKYYNL